MGCLCRGGLPNTVLQLTICLVTARACARSAPSQLAAENNVIRTKKIVKLKNYDLADPLCTVQLVGLGHSWDLHNFADFVGLEYDAEARSAVLSWKSLEERNPWGDDTNKYKGCSLLFRGVKSLRVRPRQSGASSDGRTLSDLAKVIPGEQEYRRREKWLPEHPFDLRFEFEDESVIEVSADSSELVGLLKVDV